MSLVTFKEFIIVPKELEAEFILKVVNGYFDTTIMGMKDADPIYLTNELKISDQMVDMLHQVIEEDDESADTDIEFDYYIHDIFLVLERLKLSYQLDDDSSYHNLPMVGVW